MSLDARNGSDGTWPGTSWYQLDCADIPKLPPLESASQCGVTVIGAGLAGLNTALALSERGHSDIVVLEAGQPGHGASGHNGGFVFAGYSLSNQALIAQLGTEKARLLHGWTRDAVGLVARRAELIGDCQVNQAGVLLADWFGDDQALMSYAQNMHKDLGFELSWVGPEDLGRWVKSRRYGSGLHEPGSFHLQPLRYIRGLVERLLARGVRVCGDSSVRWLEQSKDGWSLHTDRGRLQAAEVILATGGYERRLVPKIQRSLQPVATYIAVTEPLANLSDFLPSGAAVYDTRFAFDYYRPLPDQRLLWGGRISMAARSPRAIRGLLRRDLKKVFPELASARFEQAWGGWMSYASHEMPLLGRAADGLWYATGFGGHGIAPTTLAGEVLAEALCGQTERLLEFSRWPPGWAGGFLGRWAGQVHYWTLQTADAMRSCKKFLTR